MGSTGVDIGMRVYASDGLQIGRVVLQGEGYFLVRRGFFRPRKYTVRLNSIREVRGGAVYLTQAGAELTTERTSGLGDQEHQGSVAQRRLARSEALKSEAREDLRAERRMTDDGGHIQEHQ
jgi:hypothetical protein